MSQIVDTTTAQEFMKEALDKVASEELNQICAELEVKAALFREKLAPARLLRLATAEYFSLLRRIFATRRKAKDILEAHPLPELLTWTRDLLYGPDELATRFQTFVDRFPELDTRLRFDMASELLHFSNPERYWLWTRWMWDPKTRTGALPLVTEAGFDFTGDSIGDSYMRVGEAVAFVHEVGDAAGFQTISRHIFGTDVFLSCVYVVYVYTVLRLRMTQEFNKVMPDFPEFSRRLLGVYKLPMPEPAEN